MEISDDNASRGPASRNFTRLNVRVWWVFFWFSMLSGPLILLYCVVISHFTKDRQIAASVVLAMMSFHALIYTITTFSLRKWSHVAGMVLLFPLALFFVMFLGTFGCSCAFGTCV
jgi:hypothetical protein